ncbi:MAG: CAP domain-containing protein [Peptococcaceae bacterium]|nr:CAP domain-containing protein [Peptococcaceae bacterium]MDH7524338.1 CAP domain-containing protein [Peptococcaceae bacterium]
MKRSMKRNTAVLLLALFVSCIFFTGQAYASWGAAKIAELRAKQSGGTVMPEPMPPVQEPPAGQGEMSQEESLLLKLVNDERTKNGLKPLQPMPELNHLARLKSEDIIKYNYFSHTSPTYGSFAKMVYDAGIRFYSVGENLAKGRSVTHAFYMFLGSAGHRANMLNSSFTHTGIGVVHDQYGVVVTQLFIMK